MAVTEDVAGGTFTRLAPQECAEMMEAGTAVMLDIREIHEFDAERIPGAILAPMQEIIPGALPTQDAKKLILQCRSGGRTANVAHALIGMGAFSEMAHLEGGILAWKAQGLPTICPDPSRAVT
jgi:rhodanese-related sulfurtransferase